MSTTSSGCSCATTIDARLVDVFTVLHFRPGHEIVDPLAGPDEVLELTSWAVDHVPKETICLTVVSIVCDVEQV